MRCLGCHRYPIKATSPRARDPYATVALPPFVIRSRKTKKLLTEIVRSIINPHSRGRAVTKDCYLRCYSENFWSRVRLVSKSLPVETRDFRYKAQIMTYAVAVGGNFLNIFVTSLSSFFVFFFGLPDRSLLDAPLHSSCLELPSNILTISVPTW